MNSIQLACSGNCFTKPLMCWSILDYFLIIGIGMGVFSIITILSNRKRRK